MKNKAGGDDEVGWNDRWCSWVRTVVAEGDNSPAMHEEEASGTETIACAPSMWETNGDEVQFLIKT